MDLKSLEPDLDRAMAAWRAYEKDLIRQGLPGPLPATAIGVKVADRAGFERVLATLLPQAEQVHIGTVNDRFIATFVLLQPYSAEKFKLIKLLERRPGSSDAAGLDHIDFYAKDIQAAADVLAAARANWEEQSNDVHRWLSVRYGEDLEYEAKFVDHLVLDAAITEMQIAKKRILPQ